MVDFVSDSLNLDGAIQHLCKRVTKHGGLINDKLTIEAISNN